MFERPIVGQLVARLEEPRKLIQALTGPRQTGKTTAIKQVLGHLAVPYRLATADQVPSPSETWLEAEWMQARSLASQSSPAVLVVDEVQKVPQWAGIVKRLWNEDTLNDIPLQVVLIGSATFLFQKGLNETLAGQFELTRSTHWTLQEMHDAFGYTLDDYLMFGGYPGTAELHENPDDWLSYMRDSVIDSTISKDLLQMEDIRKPALMQKLFYLGAQCSAQEVSYRKLLGQLDDKGNTDIIASYLSLLNSVGLLQALQKYTQALKAARRSSPRLIVMDTSLMVAAMDAGPASIENDPTARGRLVETAVGAYLLRRARDERFEVYRWRDGAADVDFVIRQDGAVTAIEVESGRAKSKKGLPAFVERFPGARPLVVGDAETPLESFLTDEVPLFYA